MATTASLPQKVSGRTRIFCRIRQRVVVLTPEEGVRQDCLTHLVEKCSFPAHLIAVEVSIKQLTRHPNVPNRRIDIVCYRPSDEGLQPLLLIECKAHTPRTQFLHQINGYNFFIDAPYLGIAWPGQFFLTHKGRSMFRGAMDLLPSYSDLLCRLS